MSTNTPAPGQPQYPGQQPQGFVPPAAPKKKHRFRNFVVFPALGVVALIVVVTAASGGGDSTDSGSQPSSSKTTKAPADRGAPRPVTVGAAFTIGKHRLDAGWKVQYEQYLGTKVTGTVTNVSNSTSTAIFHVKFLKGSTVVGNMQCVSNDLEPGQSEAVECMNTVQGDSNLTRKGSYDKVTAEATF